MADESTDREFLLAAKAVELGIVTADDLANAVDRCNYDDATDLLWALEDEAALNTEKLSELRSLFGLYQDSLVSEISESIEDSFFGKLNDALGDVDNEELKASIARWGRASSSSLQDVSEEDRFEILSEHARGGLGEVLLARDRQLNRQVALKRIREKWADHQQARSRFQLEAEITGRLEHPGVVPVYALGQRDGGEIYYAMRFIRGESLEDAVATWHKAAGDHPVDLRSPQFRNLLRRFVDVCNTIAYAHSRGIIHRDLKPANIMLGKYGETLVVDWGLAKQVGVEEQRVREVAESRILSDTGSGSAPTQFGSAVGTPQYMSPEQAAGRLDRMGPLTDVFGLGATLYQVLTGQPPQPNDSLEKILDRVEHGEVIRPAEFNATVPLALEAICLKAMAVRPTDRYGSPRDLGDDIERWIADEPVAVCRDSLVIRMSRWVRKNQTLAVSTAVATVLLIIGGIAWNEVNHAREQREAQIEKRQQVRLTRLRDGLSATKDMVRQQIDDGRFEVAISVLTKEVETLSPEPGFDAERQKLQEQVARLKRISQYRALAIQAQQHNYLAQDQDEIAATFASLKLLGVWKHADWWNHLPSQDLRKSQQQQLRDDVYRSLVLLASTMMKQTGARTLAEGEEIPTWIFDQLRLLGEERGKPEARATVRICDLASRYRYAECLRWYRSMAALRLTGGFRVGPWKLKSPRNAADAYELGILTVTRAASPDFPFYGYRGVHDDLMSARETMAIASEMGPEQYWTHLVLAQSQYLSAKAASDGRTGSDDSDTIEPSPEAWERFDTCRQTFGRCISLEPDLPFAYADLSTVSLLESELLERSAKLDEDDVNRIRADLLESCVRNALVAVELGPNFGFVHWHYGHALLGVGRVEEAMQAYALAVKLNLQFRDDGNASLVDMNEIRGTGRLVPALTDMVENGDRRPSVLTALAGGHISRGHLSKARPLAEAACEDPDAGPDAWVFQGVISLKETRYQNAVDCFKRALDMESNSPCAAVGLALSYEGLEKYQKGLEVFESALPLVRTAHHAGDVNLGLCRLQMRTGDLAAAAASVVQARVAHPACLMGDERAIAESLGAKGVVAAIDANSLVSAAEILETSQGDLPDQVPVLNGDFELPLPSFWGNPSDSSWVVKGGGQSQAILHSDAAYAGDSGLHIISTGLAEGARAMTRQSITVQQSESYEVSVMIRSRAATNDSFFVSVVPEGTEDLIPVVKASSGVYDWTSFHGTFQAPKPRLVFRTGDRAKLSHQPVPMTLYLVSANNCNVMVDDITVRLIRSEEPGGSE